MAPRERPSSAHACTRALRRCRLALSTLGWGRGVNGVVVKGRAKRRNGNEVQVTHVRTRTQVKTRKETHTHTQTHTHTHSHTCTGGHTHAKRNRGKAVAGGEARQGTREVLIVGREGVTKRRGSRKMKGGRWGCGRALRLSLLARCGALLVRLRGGRRA